MSPINFALPQTGNFLVDVIIWLVSIGGSIAVGVILFTVLLKIITLPFDIISKAKARKNSLKMEEMRPELEKLQQQYAGDKALYSQKMMALYKKNGYSMFGTCLPTILTLIIFIVAINGFTSYSTYQNKMYFYNMANAYNQAIYSGIEEDGDYIVIDKEKNTITINAEKYYESLDNGTPTDPTDDLTSANVISGNIDYSINIGVDNAGEENEQKYMTIKSDNSFMEVKIYFTETFDETTGEFVERKFNTIPYFNVLKDRIETTTLKTQFNNDLKVLRYNDDGSEKYLTYSQFVAEEQAKIDEANSKLDLTDPTVVPATLDEQKTAELFVKEIGQTMAAKSFRSENARFLWIKNIWVTDSPLAHPINANASSINNASNGCSDCTDCSSCGQAKEVISENNYATLIAKLNKEQTEVNGYFVLTVLTIISSLGLQLITMKSQKAQMELQTVDGKGMGTQKMMMWMMPIMMAFFSFMYTAAFSIYMVLSSVISIITTLLINYIMNKKYKGSTPKKQVVHGRVYTPKVKENTKDKKEKNKDKKKKEESKGDFIPGGEVKKHFRGRIK